MPIISLDNQIFFNSNKTKTPPARRQELEVLVTDALLRHPELQLPTGPHKDPIMISSDDESDYNDSTSQTPICW